MRFPRDKTDVAKDGPLICMPLVGTSVAEIRAELAAVLAEKPDAVEWRVDYFASLDDAAEVLSTVRAIRVAVGEIPLIFTCRAVHEGGVRHAVPQSTVTEVYEAVCAAGEIDAIDCELSQAPETIARLRAASRARNVALILSFHDFQATPGEEVLLAKVAEAEARGADIVKLAVMPRSIEDVTALLEATRRAGRVARIPLITMSMGEVGLKSRIEGWKYGSMLTFAAGKNASAPGQISISELRAAIAASRA